MLVDQLGRMAGLCGDDEIYRALLQQRRAAEGAGATGPARPRPFLETDAAFGGTNNWLASKALPRLRPSAK